MLQLQNGTDTVWRESFAGENFREWLKSRELNFRELWETDRLYMWVWQFAPVDIYTPLIATRPPHSMRIFVVKTFAKFAKDLPAKDSESLQKGISPDSHTHYRSMSYRLTRALVSVWRRRLSSAAPNGLPGNGSRKSVGLWRPAAFTILVRLMFILPMSLLIGYQPPLIKADIALRDLTSDEWASTESPWPFDCIPVNVVRVGARHCSIIW